VGWCGRKWEGATESGMGVARNVQSRVDRKSSCDVELIGVSKLQKSVVCWKLTVKQENAVRKRCCVLCIRISIACLSKLFWNMFNCICYFVPICGNSRVIGNIRDWIHFCTCISLSFCQTVCQIISFWSPLFWLSYSVNLIETLTIHVLCYTVKQDSYTSSYGITSNPNCTGYCVASYIVCIFRSVSHNCHWRSPLEHDVFNTWHVNMPTLTKFWCRASYFSGKDQQHFVLMKSRF